MLADMLPSALAHGKALPEEVVSARAKVVAGLQEHSTKANDLGRLIGAVVVV